MAGRVAYYGGIVQNGLVFDVDAAKKASYVGSGDAWNDLKSGYNGILTNGPTYNSSNGGSLLFNGSNEYVNIDSVLTPLASTTTGTWSCWVKPTTLVNASIGLFIDFGDTNANEILYIGMLNGGKIRCFGRNAATPFFSLDTDAIAFTVGVWTHVALVQDAVSPVLYVDGVAVPQTFIDATAKTNWFVYCVGIDNGRIACRDYASVGNAQFFNGNIASVQIYNRALSATEVLQNYNATKGRYL